MRAVQIHAFGGPEVLRLDELPLPEPKADELIVRVCAAGLNPIDATMRAGRYPNASEDDLPLPLSRDVSGVVERCGTAVTTVTEGDAVFAFIGRGRAGHGERVAVRAAEAAPKPRSVGHIAAAAVPLAATAAWQGLFDHGLLQPGQRVLVHGGAGGVGHFAIQLAKRRGAFVATTARGEDIGLVEELGADQAIDYTAERFEEAVGDIDLVLDLVGGETQERSWAVLRHGGVIVSTLGHPSGVGARGNGRRGISYMASPSAGELALIGRLIDRGALRPVLQATYPLADIAAAHRRLERGHARGKVVLEVAG